MSIKSLFLNGGEDDKKAEVKKDVTDLKMQFPPVSDTTPQVNNFNTTPAAAQFFSPSNVEPDQEHMNNALKVYQDAFDGMAQQGYGFYQFYKMITTAGVDNPQSYTMAFMMGASMDKSVTKDKLIQQSDYYIGKINEGYNAFINQGTTKKQGYLAQKDNETQALKGDLDLMNQQMEALKIQINDRKNKLTQIDGKYAPMIGEIDSKLAANDKAKNQIVGSINQVKNGIQNNLK